jgi:glycogen(starch) synthase
LREWKADLVHVQCVSSNAPFAGRASQTLDLPLVVSSQGELSMDANHTFERSALARSMMRRALARADVITGCSQFVIDEINHFTAGKFAAKARVISNGIDVEECSNAIPASRGRPYVLGLGRLVPQKGFDVLIRAFESLAPDLLDHELVIAGDGPERARLMKLVDDRQLGSRTHFTGLVEHREALELMAGASAFVLCSTHEPQGIVVLEAMAVGTPVIASAVGGVPEIVDGTNGFLFPANDQHALATRVREVLLDNATADDLRQSGRATANRFSWSTITKEYASAYQDAGA